MKIRRSACALMAVLTVWGPGGKCTADALAVDGRIRTVVYGADEVYRLRGYVGYQIDLEFQEGERFVGLGAGDVESITVGAEGNHLFCQAARRGDRDQPDHHHQPQDVPLRLPGQ